MKIDNTEVWCFAACGADTSKGQWADFVEISDEDGYIVVRNKWQLFSSFLLSKMRGMIVVRFGDEKQIVGGPGPADTVIFKEEMAKKLQLESIWTSSEKFHLNKASQQAAAAAAAVVKAAKEEDQKQIAERNAVRQKKVDDIMSREKVTAFTEDGRTMFGVPIFDEEEWKMLSNNTYCIRMESNLPVEAFVVGKGKQPFKKYSAIVSLENKKSKKHFKDDSMPNIIGSQNVKVRDDARSNVPIVESMDDVKKLQKAGLNSGSWVIAPDAKGVKTVYAVHHDGIKTIGTIRSAA